MAPSRWLGCCRYLILWSCDAHAQSSMSLQYPKFLFPRQTFRWYYRLKKRASILDTALEFYPTCWELCLFWTVINQRKHWNYRRVVGIIGWPEALNSMAAFSRLHLFWMETQAPEVVSMFVFVVIMHCFPRNTVGIVSSVKNVEETVTIKTQSSLTRVCSIFFVSKQATEYI